MFEVVDSELPGARLLLPQLRDDLRGRFVKNFHAEFFANHGMAIDFKEQYYSVSQQRVLRGMHFQIPPHDNVKLVTCLTGEIFDVLLDLRLGSPTRGRHQSFRLTAERGEQLYVPRGFAHGFYVRSPHATVLYSATTVFAPQHDAGLRWDSAGIQWPDEDPLLSDKDRQLPPLGEFASPFAYESAT